jgi:hypothetical protein
VSHGYEHFGVLLRSAEDLQQLWDDLANDEDGVEPEPLSPSERGEGSFRFRHPSNHPFSELDAATTLWR